MQNVGSIDRILRLVVGTLLLLTPFLPPTAPWVADWGNWKYALSAAGAVMLVTAIARVCPAYSLLGIRTCPARRR